MDHLVARVLMALPVMGDELVYPAGLQGNRFSGGGHGVFWLVLVRL
jgi:hypothetical protein